MFYICTNPEWNKQDNILNIKQVIKLIQEHNSGVILPANPSEQLLEFFNIKKVDISYLNGDKLEKELDLDRLDYCDLNIKRITNNKGKYTVELEYLDNSNKTKDRWRKIRTKRDKLLLETDWVMLENGLTDSCKEKYKAYRQLLRDITKIYDSPKEVIYPEPPLINYINTTDSSKLTKKQIDFIEAYSPKANDLNDWNKFLKEWKNTKFTKNRQAVLNLIKLYTNVNIETQLNNLEKK